MSCHCATLTESDVLQGTVAIQGRKETKIAEMGLTKSRTEITSVADLGLRAEARLEELVTSALSIRR